MPFCNHCGSEYVLGSQQCGQCRKSLPQLPAVEAPHAATAEPSRFLRLLAGAIDLAVAFGGGMLLQAGIGRKVLLLGFVRMAVVLALPFIYLLLKDALGGKSVGKLMCGLVVYNQREGKLAGAADSILRNWILLVPIVGVTMVGAQIATGRSRRAGDGSAGTVVITDLDYMARS